MSDEAALDVERRGPVLVITLRRPERLNAIDQPMATALAAAVQQLDDSPDLAVGVVTGAAGHFSSGMDLRSRQAGGTASVPGRGFAGIVEAPPGKPLIAAVEGWALGGGFEIALACDLIVAAEGARFGLPEVKRGVVAAGGGVLRLPQRLPRAVAAEMILTGDVLTADRAERLGLVNLLTPDGEALSAAVDLAQRIAANAPLAVVASKRVLVESASWSAETAFARQHEVFAPVFVSEDAREGARAFTEKRPPSWTGR